jgi:hypothetical protein
MLSINDFLKTPRNEIFFSMLAIVASEIMIFFGMVYSGMAIHILNLQVITLVLIFKNDPSEIKMIVSF